MTKVSLQTANLLGMSEAKEVEVVSGRTSFCIQADNGNSGQEVTLTDWNEMRLEDADSGNVTYLSLPQMQKLIAILRYAQADKGWDLGL